MWTKKGKGLACLVPAFFQGRRQAPFQRQAPGSLLCLFPHIPQPPFFQQQLKPCSCHAAGKGRQKHTNRPTVEEEYVGHNIPMYHTIAMV